LQDKQYAVSAHRIVERFPPTSNRSLRAWASSDELMLAYFNENDLDHSGIAIYNDRFGYLATHLADHDPILVTTYRSQEASIIRNLNQNGLPDLEMIHLTADITTEITTALVKVPKSMDLFRLILSHIASYSKEDTIVLCGFMTKYFTKKMLEIAAMYFEEVGQSKAHKKARLLILQKPKQVQGESLMHSIPHQLISGNEVDLDQYYGVFSAKQVDYATQFLLSRLEVDASINIVLDLASGNGVIGLNVIDLLPNAEVHFLDDSQLAIESSKLNLAGHSGHFHYNYKMNDLQSAYFDLVICNPPFHFEHENTIEIALELFEGTYRVLKEEGRFVCVANLHLNYQTHLKKIFDQVDVVDMNSKFVVYECWK